MNPLDLPTLLRRAQLIELGISKHDIPALVQSGSLHVIRLKDNGKRYFLRDSVLKLINPQNSNTHHHHAPQR